MSAAIATQVFGSEVRIGLIRHFRNSPCSMNEAAEALDLPQPVVSRNTRVLMQAGVVVGDPPSSGRRVGRYVVDEVRLRSLAEALMQYCLDEEPSP